ncbi:MAG: protein-L-isoaspartate(D-aspartate) O-methyltransferase [Planctomycetota bacterium]|nr:protein-L-isoaspartate(D-aspartate) O-methyltransferase [Planctomycetota bacterium]
MNKLLPTSFVFQVLFLTGLAQAQPPGSPFTSYAELRNRLVQDVLVPGGVQDERVLSAIRNTPRHEFVPLNFRNQAYFDRALPIGAAQTISSPFIVAMMTQELDTEGEHKVLEIGTGSGYQAAVLSPLVKEVYSIEIVPELGRSARRVLSSLGYKNITTKIGDGFKGWQEHAPFDRIIVTCSPEDVPKPLVDQLVEGGLMVVPVGERFQQTLYLMRKKGGKLEREALRPTLFVPMTGTAEDNRKVIADPANPVLMNGDFERDPPKNGFMDGWYYQRQLTWKKEESPSGKAHVEFENDVAGRPANLLQGVALDGREVPRIELSAMVKLESVRPGLSRDELPAVTIRFFDEQRSLLGTHFIGPFFGTRDWKEEKRVFRVPNASRFAIVSIGLLGGVGTASFDAVKLQPAKR